MTSGTKGLGTRDRGPGGALSLPGPRALLVLFLAWFLTACAGSKKPELYTAEARVAIEERQTTGTVLMARREVPWRGTVLTERVPVAPPAAADSKPAEGTTPGLRIARERLAARAILEAKLREKAAALPATDPIPGAERGRTVAELAEREPTVRVALDELSTRGIEERFVRVERSVTDFIEGSARLESLGDAVLAAGGGRRVDDSDIERRSADAAISKARAELLDKLSRHPVKGAANLGEWARASAANALAYERLVRDIRIESSGPESTPTGREWVVRLALPTERVEQAILPVAKRKPAPATKSGGAPR